MHSEMILAIDPSWLNRIAQAIADDYRLKINGKVVAEYYGRRGEPKGFHKSGSVAVIPVSGVITQRPSVYDWGDETYTEWIGEQVDAAVADSSISEIVLDIDSPGGTVYGVMELGDKLDAAKGQKKITAIANSMAASAAYWIGSQATKFYVNQGGEVGSIGVYQLHMDRSKLMEDIGVKATFISAGKYKVEGNPFEPLGDEARADMQSSVDRYYEAFVGAVARGRQVSKAQVKKDMGEGRMKGAADAKAAGMVDGITTLEGYLTKVNAAAANRRRLSALRLQNLSTDC